MPVVAARSDRRAGVSIEVAAGATYTVAMLKMKHRPLTVRDYRELPEGPPHYQLIEGDLYMSPSPNRYHQHISRNIEFVLMKYLEAHPSGIVYHAPFDVELTDLNVYQPDIVFVRNAHRSILTDQGAGGAPDVVVEILSPRTSRFDLGVKREVYARTGVEELWIVDPDAKRLMVYRLQENADSPHATHGETATFTSPLFPGLTFLTTEFFRFD